MALLNKFFAKCRSSERSAKVTEVPLKLSPEFTRDQLRVVIMRDSSTRGFRLLFDSASVEQVPLPARPSCQKQTPGACSLSWTHSRSASRPEKQCNEFAEKTDGYGYRYLALKSDVAKLMEMAFGSGAMRCQGCTSKIHYLTSSKVQKRGIFISLVFPAPPRRRRDWQHSSHSDASLDSSLSSAGDFGNETASNTSDPAFPSQSSSSQILSHADPWCHLQSDSTAARNRESRASMGPPSHASSASLESESNSVEGGNDVNKTRCYRWMHRKSTAESLDAADYERGRRMCRSGTKLALGLVVDLGSDFPSRERLEWFLLVHMRSIDTLLWKLKAVLENVYACAPFVHTIFLAVEDILQSVVDLYVVPRLLRPLWTVISVGNEEVWHSVAAEFIPELVAVVDLYDSKDTHFFVSTVLSAVLTHHLGWTNQFLREISSSGSNPLLTPSTGSSIQTQADDICGLVGFPPVSAKTVVLGTDLTIIHRFLALIPYFIRCDPVKETSFGPPNLNLQACRSSVSQDTLTPDFSPRLKRTRSHAAKLVEKLYPDLGMHKKTLSADFSARRGEHPGKPVQFVLGHDDEQLVLHSSPDLRECADVECEPVEMVLLESEEASLAAAANKVFKESLSVETLKPEISPKLKRTCSFTSKLADEFAQSNACQHRKTRSADFRLSVPVQAEVIAEDDDDDERKPPVVEFVLGQNERLVLNKVKEQGVCEKQLIQVKEMVIPEIKIETVTPVGRSCAIRKTLDGCKSWSRRHWHQRVDRLSREAARVTVVRTTRFDMNNSPSHCQRRSSDPVDAKVPEEFLGRFSRFLSLQVGDSGRKRGSISEGQRACLYPNLSLEEDFDGLGCLPEQVDNLDLEGIDCPRVDVLGVNTDPSWTPSRTMFAGVGPRIVCGVALSGVLVPPPSSSASGMHHGGGGGADVHAGSFSSATSSNSSGFLSSTSSMSSSSSMIFQRALMNDLCASVKACDVQPEAVCILADTGNWVVETINQPRSVSWPLSQAQGQMAVAAPCVASMLETVVSLAKAKTDPWTCMTILENHLREMFLRSFALKEYLVMLSETGNCDIQQMCHALDIEINDVPLLMSIISTHSPNVARMYGLAYK